MRAVALLPWRRFAKLKTRLAVSRKRSAALSKKPPVRPLKLKRLRAAPLKKLPVRRHLRSLKPRHRLRLQSLFRPVRLSRRHLLPAAPMPHRHLALRVPDLQLLRQPPAAAAKAKKTIAAVLRAVLRHAAVLSARNRQSPSPPVRRARKTAVAAS